MKNMSLIFGLIFSFQLVWAEPPEEDVMREGPDLEEVVIVGERIETPSNLQKLQNLNLNGSNKIGSPLPDRSPASNQTIKIDEEKINKIGQAVCRSSMSTSNLHAFCMELSGGKDYMIEGQSAYKSSDATPGHILRFFELAEQSCGMEEIRICQETLKDNFDAIVNKEMPEHLAKAAGGKKTLVDGVTLQVSNPASFAYKSASRGSYMRVDANSSDQDKQNSLQGNCQQLAGKLSNIIKQHANDVVRCEILATMLREDKTDSKATRFEVSEESEREIRSMNPMLMTGCEHSGFSTDYDDCKRLISGLNASMVAEKAAETAGHVNMIAQQSRVQRDLADPTKGQADLIGAARTTVRTSKENAVAMEATLTAQAATIGGFMASFQTPKKVKKRCENLIQGNASEYCDVFMNRSIQKKFFNNLEVLDHAKTALIDVIGKMTVKGVEILALSKQLNNLETTEELLQELDKKSPDNLVEMQMGLCQAKPNDPSCVGGGQYVGVDNSGLGFNVGGFANNLGSSDGANFSPDTGSSNSATGNSGGALNDLPPSARLTDITPTDSIDLGNGSRVKFADGAGGGGAGGGAPGALGGGAAGGGGSSGSGSDRSPAGDLSIAKSKLAYGPGGGFKIGPSGRAKNENPFDRLVKKDDKQGGNLDFRGPASEVGDSTKSIWVRISERYTKVNGAKKLLEYEMK